MFTPLRPSMLLAGLALLVPADRSMALDTTQAAHLLSRTGFGPTAAELKNFEPLSFTDGVQRLLDGVRRDARTPPPEWVSEPLADRRAMRMLPEEERREIFREIQMQNQQRAQELKGWWYREMLSTDSPLTERLTLFWHNHFTSSHQKVRSPQLLYQQNLLLRRHAMGNFREFLHAIARDPAMIVYLDNVNNRKGQPNENFARELLELFTLGEGNYSEQDIKEAARAFTGWHVDRQNAAYRFNGRQHDGGVKTFMGQTGHLTGEDVIEIICKQPRMAEYVTEKFWREFISDEPDPAEVQRLAKVFRESDYEIRPLLETMLLSPQFTAEVNRGRLVKSPVELMVGTLRTFEIPLAEPMVLVRQGRLLGQDILNPPNVKGWPGGTNWINTNTLLQRSQFLDRVISGQDPDRVEMGRGMRDRQGFMMARGGGGAMTEEQQAMRRRAMELRRQGLERREIRDRLQEEGFQVPQRGGFNREGNRQQRERMRGQERPDQSEKTRPDAARPDGGDRPRRDPEQMRQRMERMLAMATPTADIDRWLRALPDSLSNGPAIANYLAPLPPVEASVGSKSMKETVKAVVLDPVYQLK